MIILCGKKEEQYEPMRQKYTHDSMRDISYTKNGVTKSPNSVIDQLSDCNVKPITVIKPKVGDCYVYAIAETKMRGWYLDDILHVMFSKVRPHFEDIKK